MQRADVLIRIRGDTTGLVRTQQEAARANASLGRLAKGAAAVAGGYVGFHTLARAVTASVTAIANFEAQMNRVAALTGANGAGLASLSALAREMGETTQFSATQAADAMGFLAMAGFSVDEILRALPDTLALAAAAQMDLGETADIVSNILTGYNLKTSDLAHANDVLVATFTRTNTNLSQLGEAMKYVGPVASAFGIEIEEAAAAIGLLGNAGLQGEMAGTALRGMLTRLASPSNQAQTILDRLGVTVFETNGDMRAFAEILRDLEGSGITAAEIMEVFGQRAGPGMQVLLTAGSEALQQFTADLSDVKGITQEIAEVQMKGLSGAWKELKSAAEGLALQLGEGGLGPALEGVTRGVTAVIRAVRDGTSGLGVLAGGLVYGMGNAADSLHKTSDAAEDLEDSADGAAGSIVGLGEDAEEAAIRLEKAREAAKTLAQEFIDGVAAVQALRNELNRNETGGMRIDRLRAEAQAMKDLANMEHGGEATSEGRDLMRQAIEREIEAKRIEQSIFRQLGALDEQERRLAFDRLELAQQQSALESELVGVRSALLDLDTESGMGLETYVALRERELAIARELAVIEGELGKDKPPPPNAGLTTQERFGLITADPMGDVVGRTQEQLMELHNSFGTVADQIANGSVALIQNSMYAVGDSITGLIQGTMTWGDAFRNVGSAVLQTLVQIGVQMVTQSLLRRALGQQETAAQIAQETAKAPALATNAAAASIGSFGGAAVVGGIAAIAAIGMIMGALAFRERGGPVARGGAYIVGERRAEVFEPAADGVIHPSVAAYEQSLRRRTGSGTESTAPAAGATPANVTVAIFESESAARGWAAKREEQVHFVDMTRRTRWATAG